MILSEFTKTEEKRGCKMVKVKFLNFTRGIFTENSLCFLLSVDNRDNPFLSIVKAQRIIQDVKNSERILNTKPSRVFR